MTTLVLTVRRTLTAEAAEKRGEDVIVLLPEAQLPHWQQEGLPYPVHAVKDWHDYTQLAELAYSLPPIHRIVTLDEMCIAAAGFLRGALGVAGQDFSTATTFTDKAVMKHHLAHAGVRVAPWRVACSLDDIPAIADELGWPVVVKPRTGFGVLNTHRLNSVEELRKLQQRDAFVVNLPNTDAGRAFAASRVAGRLDDTPWGFLVEEYQDVVEEFQCDMTLRASKVCMPTFTGRYSAPVMHFVSSTQQYSAVTTLPPTHPDVTVVEALTRRAASALNYTDGPLHCEVLKTRSGEYVLGEIACRVGGVFLPRMSQLLYDVDTLQAATTTLFDEALPTVCARRYPYLVGAAVLMPAGVVHRAPTPDDFHALPGFVDAEIMCKPGSSHSDALGSLQFGAYLFFVPSQPANAEAINAETQMYADHFRKFLQMH